MYIHFLKHLSFFRGAIGTGVCIFSKGLIVEAISHRYPLNGYAHKIWHGDWFGGKSAGLCKIFYKGININFYSTHVSNTCFKY